jgi:Leucine Rich repeat
MSYHAIAIAFVFLTFDVQGGITYIAQVLKRNRTLKILNLSENKIDVQGLVYLAEALVSRTRVLLI